MSEPPQFISTGSFTDFHAIKCLINAFHIVATGCRTNLMKLRSDYKDAFVEKHGVKLGLMSGFVKV